VRATSLSAMSCLFPSTLAPGPAWHCARAKADLKKEINAAIKAIRANGKYKAINDKYFKFDVYGK
jgi:ABC-type amino acid transport substrate-binding protein